MVEIHHNAQDAADVDSRSLLEALAKEHPELVQRYVQKLKGQDKKKTEKNTVKYICGTCKSDQMFMHPKHQIFICTNCHRKRSVYFLVILCGFAYVAAKYLFEFKFPQLQWW
ncbi:hypothetical protein CEUSTIGMA_g4931.t1 [Chlamydomonas eustigma]|uniref:Uncharacterized protein n=1 Tax=Chlamydomonas eustigma TaxID=1157962 RepID=A0A250X338_9CHLO|nr:hypothetical protein CEUSTIGMA_g4931.t1 [Chlamydomonas eustigma]|eukprot:GAX77487.1 hypothetical protein CEUSTIGMA_g4931.t1 [Chlamydomonas eustigma]